MCPVEVVQRGQNPPQRLAWVEAGEGGGGGGDRLGVKRDRVQEAA